MLAHDFLKKDDRMFTPISSNRSAWYFLVLILTKLLRCIGIFFIDILAKSVHVASLLWMLKFISSLILMPLQKPLSNGKTLRKPLLLRIARISAMNCLIEILWFYGITFCGPLRSVLVFELSPSVILVAFLSVFKESGSTAKSRGLFCLFIGFISLMLLDKDHAIEDSHNKAHAHHSGLNHLFYHLIGMVGVADHQGGVFILIISLLLRIGYDSSFRHLAVEIGGPKRLYSLVTLFSAIMLMPVGILLFAIGNSFIPSYLEFILLLITATIFVMVLDSYAESVCFQHVADPVMASARWSPVTMFSCALGLATLWYSSEGKNHSVTGGVVVTVVSFILASMSLTSSNAPKSRGGHFVGISDTGLPLYTYGEAFLKTTSRSMLLFAKETLREILANSDSRRIFFFLCVNLGFCGVEFLYGFWTNSLGLISDGFHMLFDCFALVMGLVASVMSRWPATKNFSYGFGRVEVVSGFINAMFLCVIAMFIVIEALERLFDPPNINTDKLLFVAVSGLIVNIFGMYSFHGDGEHGHSHHGHSHGGGHGHSHGGNANMEGVFLHVLADTLGSVFVIISTLLIQWFGWTWVDPLCSLILSLLILGSVYPLLMSSGKTLLQNIPDEFDEEFEHHLSEALEIEGVQSYSQPHFWQLKSDLNVASVHIQAQEGANAQMIRHKVLALLKTAGATQSTVQVEKDQFSHRIQQLCPGYRLSHRITKGSAISRRKQNGHNHSHGGHSHDGGHGHSHGNNHGHGHSHDNGHGHSH